MGFYSELNEMRSGKFTADHFNAFLNGWVGLSARNKGIRTEYILIEPPTTTFGYTYFHPFQIESNKYFLMTTNMAAMFAYDTSRSISANNRIIINHVLLIVTIFMIFSWNRRKLEK